MKNKKIILVAAIVAATIIALYFGGSMLMQFMDQAHVPPPH
jgi:hypothetical protein